MTCRKGLIVGLLVALSAAPTVVRAVESTAWQPPTSSDQNALPSIKLQPGTATKIAATDDWKPSEQSEAGDIRFKKPGLAAPAALTGPVTANPIEKPARVPVANTPISLSIPSGKVEITDRPTPAVIPPAKPPATVTTAITTATSAKAEAPAIPLLEESAPAAGLPQPNPEPIAENPSRPEVRLTDEQLQLVARILNDGDVIRAAQEEPLPGAPNAERNRDADEKQSGGPEQHNGDMYYGDCCPPQPQLFWVAGVEATFLSPDLNSDGTSWAVEDVIEDREEVYTSEDVDSMYLSPRLWIGVQGCAWGANLRYWHLNASESSFDPSIGRDGTWDAFDCGKPNVGFFSMSRLEAYTIDFEITRRFCLHDCAMQGSIGVRHAEIEHADSITGTALSTDATLFGYAEADRYTRGTGLVFGWYGRKPLFPCSCVHWYYNLRWSALWGPTGTAVETGATVLATSANAGSTNGAYTCVDDNLFIGEVQLGLEWNYALQCVPANAFFRAGVEYQRWTGGMGYSESGSFAGIKVTNTFEQVGSTFAAAAAPELDLIGLTLGTGLTW